MSENGTTNGMPPWIRRNSTPWVVALTLLTGGGAAWNLPGILSTPPKDISEVSTIVKDNSDTIKENARNIARIIDHSNEQTILMTQVVGLLERANETLDDQEDAFREQKDEFRDWRREMRRAVEDRADAVPDSGSAWSWLDRVGVTAPARAAE